MSLIRWVAFHEYWWVNLDERLGAPSSTATRSLKRSKSELSGKSAFYFFWKMKVALLVVGRLF